MLRVVLTMSLCAAAGCASDHASALGVTTAALDAVRAGDAEELQALYLPEAALAGCSFGNEGVEGTRAKWSRARGKFVDRLGRGLPAVPRGVRLGEPDERFERQRAAVEAGTFWTSAKYHPGSDCTVRGFVEKATVALVDDSGEVGRIKVTLVNAGGKWYLGGGKPPRVHLEEGAAPTGAVSSADPQRGVPKVGWSPPVAIDLPKVEGNGEIAPDAPGVWVGRDEIAIRYRDSRSKEWAAKRLLSFRRRVGKEHKQGDENSLLIQPLFDALNGLAKDGASDVNVFIDRGATYRTVTEVIYTAGQAEFSTFHFAVEDTKRSAFIAAAPRFSVGQTDEPPPQRVPLNLTVAIGADGFRLQAAGANLPEVLGCPEDWGGCKLPADRATLSGRIASLKSRFPQDHTVNLAADADVAWGEVLATAATLSARDAQVLFPSVVFAVAQ